MELEIIMQGKRPSRNHGQKSLPVYEEKRERTERKKRAIVMTLKKKGRIKN